MSEYEYAWMRDAVEGSRLPLSPLMLIQEQVPSRWGALVGAMMCVRTQRRASHPVTWALLARWPRPSDMAKAEPHELIPIIREAGFAETRARNLIEMSRCWWLRERREDGWWDDTTFTLPGVGPYIASSDRVFYGGLLDCVPADKELAQFVAWARAYSRAGLEWRRPFTF